MFRTFPTRTPAEFDGGADRKSGHIASNVGLKHTCAHKIAACTKGKKAGYQQRQAAESEQPEFEIVGELVH